MPWSTFQQALAEATWSRSLQRPEHLREDFCGTALICAVWCRGDCRRTATGLDIDRDALEWGCRENGSGLLGEGIIGLPRLCLLRCDVLHPVAAAECVSRLPGAPGSGKATAKVVSELPAVGEARQQADTSSADAEHVNAAPGVKGAGEQANSGSGEAKRVSGLPEMTEPCEQAKGGSAEAECVSKPHSLNEAHEQASGGCSAKHMPLPGLLLCAKNACEPDGAGSAETGSAAQTPCGCADSGADEPASLGGNSASISGSGGAAAAAPLQRGTSHVDDSGPGPRPGAGPGHDPNPARQSAHDLRCKPADIICAMNFSVCLLHRRAEVQVTLLLRHAHPSRWMYDSALQT